MEIDACCDTQAPQIKLSACLAASIFSVQQVSFVELLKPEVPMNLFLSFFIPTPKTHSLFLFLYLLPRSYWLFHIFFRHRRSEKISTKAIRSDGWIQVFSQLPNLSWNSTATMKPKDIGATSAVSMEYYGTPQEQITLFQHFHGQKPFGG